MEVEEMNSVGMLGKASRDYYPVVCARKKQDI